MLAETDIVLKPELGVKGKQLEQKRKSNSDASCVSDANSESENVPENVQHDKRAQPSPKRTRVRDRAFADNESKALKPVSPLSAKIRTGLPRFQTKIHRVTRASEKKEALKPPSVTKIDQQISPRALETVATLPLPEDVAKKVDSARHKTDLTARLAKLFDEGLSVSDDHVATIFASLRVKANKYDYKEKMKRQEVALKEVKESLQTTMSEIKAVKEKSCQYEATILSQLADMTDKLEGASHTVLAITASEQKLKREFTKVVIEAKEAIQKIEVLQAAHKEEVAGLKNELLRRQSDVAKSIEERVQKDRQNAEMREEFHQLQSSLRVAESQVTRYEQDCVRLTSELQTARDQITQKDTDLRMSFQSAHEVQRQSSDEKNALRNEISLLQSRVSQLEADRASSAEQLSSKREECLSSNSELLRMRELVSNLEVKLKEREIESVGAKEAIMQMEVERELRSRCEVREESERRERIAACAQLMATQSECTVRLKDAEERMTRSEEALREELRAMQGLRDNAVAESRAQADVITRLESEMHQLRRAVEDASANHESVEKVGQLTGELEVLRRRLREADEKKMHDGTTSAELIKDLEEQLRSGEVQRRKLHNLVQELRGNVRVFARVRPFLPSDGVDLSPEQGPDSSITVRQDGQGLRIAKPGADETAFAFDRTFGPSASQETIFQEVSEFVQSALDGYNVCLFSYGQTGSGKTHTMQGSGSGSQRGIIPRAVQQVGLYKNELESKGWAYHMEVSFVEIYNETIRDLLRSGSGGSGSTTGNGSTGNGPIGDDVKHEIKKDASGGTYISDVTMMTVDPNDSQQMEDIMELAARHRSVEKTAMNERSSRSHSIFTLYLRATNHREGTVLKGTLNLVDLAGSERLDRSLATGARLKETVAINKSLSSLVDVFVAIGNKQSHIPFRNSKLTYLLQPSLSGDGKTLMMINLSPTEDSYPESLCTLRFASQVNQCELGKPKRQLRDAPAESSDRDTATSTSTSTSTTGSGSSTSALSGSVRSASFSTLSGSASSSASLTNLSRKPSSGNIPLPPSSKSMKR